MKNSSIEADINIIIAELNLPKGQGWVSVTDLLNEAKKKDKKREQH